MSPVTANPDILEFNLCKELGLTPDMLKDQIIQLPTLRQVLGWVFGKPLYIKLKSGLTGKKVDKFLTILNEVRIQQEEEQARLENEARLRGEYS